MSYLSRVRREADFTPVRSKNFSNVHQEKFLHTAANDAFLRQKSLTYV